MSDFAMPRISYFFYLKRLICRAIGFILNHLVSKAPLVADVKPFILSPGPGGAVEDFNQRRRSPAAAHDS